MGTTQMNVNLAPSILSADFARLGDQVIEAEQAGVDRIHVGVMDGHFVPNLSMGAAIVQALRRVTHLPLEAHLTISEPDVFLDDFAAAGSDSFYEYEPGTWGPPRVDSRVSPPGGWQNPTAHLP